MRAALLFLFVGSGRLLAQEPAVITGRVIDRGSGRAVPSADITMDTDRRAAGEQGRFRFGAVQPGTHTLRVRAVGYAADVRALTILPGQTVNVLVELVPVVHQVDSMMVVASREPVIEREELASRGGDLATALNGWEGIVVSRTGHGNEAIPQIRGSAADEVLVTVDGFALNDPFTGRADLSRVAVQDVESISLLRGVQSAAGGNRALAGVIQIVTRRIRHPEVMAGIGSAESRRARIAVGLGSASVALSLDALPRDYLADLPAGGEARRANAGGEIWTLNGSARLGVDVTLRGSLSDRGLPGTIVNPTSAAQAHDRSILVGVRSGNKTWFRSSLQWLDTRAEDPAPPPGFIAYDSHTWGWGGTLELGTGSSVKVGHWAGEYAIAVDGRHDRFDGDAVRDDATFSRAGSAVSASLSRSGAGGTWTIAPAFRLDWFTGQSRPLASGRVDLRLTRGGTSFSASAGNGVTVPALADLLFQDGVGVAINPDLRPERVRWEGELGVGQAFSIHGLGGSIRLGAFYGRIEDMILWTPNFRNIWSPGNFGVLRRGGEASLDLRPSRRVLVSGSATLSHVTYDIASGSQVPYRPRASYSLQGSWNPGGWQFSLGWNHLGTRFSRNREMNPLSPFDLFTLGAERRLGSFSVRGEIRDLTDARPVYIAGFPAPGRTAHLSIAMELP